MARILPIVTLLFASAFTAQAALYCQCLYQDGSHCCVIDKRLIGNLHCQDMCVYAHRIDGTPCNAGGKHSSVSAWNAQFRTACGDN